MKQALHNLIIYILVILLTTGITDARPARPGRTIVTQPDGTTINTIIKGDEWFHIHTTEDGKAIIKDADGWWNYAIYDQNGEKKSSGYHVGKDTPKVVLSQSMMINTSAMRENAARKRELMMSRLQERQMKKAASGNSSQKTMRGLIILAAFNDVPFKYTPADFNETMNVKQGCAKEYFNDQFEGIYEFEFDISPIVTLSGNRKWYGENNSFGDDKRPAEMAKEACELAYAAGVEFSKYDMDGDGEVDNVHIFYAGGDESEGDGDDRIWAHQWSLSDAGLTTLKLDGKTIDRYSCSSELTIPSSLSTNYVIAGIGAFCHEFSHILGLPDFYDTDYERNGYSTGLWGSTSLMDMGSYNNNGNTPPNYNAIEREILGLSTCMTITEGASYSMGPINEDRKFFRMETDRNTEYYLFECRAAEGWDKHIGGDGMLVYHIDKSSSRQWNYQNSVNCQLSHQCADLIEADGRSDNFEGITSALWNNIAGVFFPYKSNTSLSATTTPALKYWSGSKCPLSIRNITKNGKAISFSVVGQNTVTPPKATDVKFAAFTDAVLINFSNSTDYNGYARIKCYNDSWSKTIDVAPYADGMYSVTIEGLEPNAKTYKAEIWFEIDGLKGNVTNISFMTKTEPETEWPYIYLNYADRGEDNSFIKGKSFPLRVNNASDATKIVWKFNGKEIKSADGYYTVTGDGSLKAEIYHEDGSKTVVVKEIIAKEE